jgi:hypothetical protein
MLSPSNFSSPKIITGTTRVRAIIRLPRCKPGARCSCSRPSAGASRKDYMEDCHSRMALYICTARDDRLSRRERAGVKIKSCTRNGRRCGRKEAASCCSMGDRSATFNIASKKGPSRRTGKTLLDVAQSPGTLSVWKTIATTSRQGLDPDTLYCLNSASEQYACFRCLATSQYQQHESKLLQLPRCEADKSCSW